MLKFKRLSELSKDEKEIVAALKQSKAGLLEVSEDGSKIRRDPAIPLPENTEESRKLLEARTAYAKGFNKETTTLDELLDHYNEANPDVVSIQMRNYCEKKGKEKVWKFKGSIFMTFKTEDAAKVFVAKEEKYKEETLLKKFQKDYLEEKKKEMEEKKNKYQKKDKKPKSEGADGKEEAEEKQEEEFKLPKVSVLKLTGLGGEVTREDIKEVLKDTFEVNIDKDGGDIAFITYEKGEAEAKIRFKKEDFAKPIAEKWVGMETVDIKDLKVVGSLMEGEEEENFLAESVKDLKNRRNKNRHGHKRKGGFNNHHGGKRGRR